MKMAKIDMLPFMVAILVSAHVVLGNSSQHTEFGINPFVYRKPMEVASSEYGSIRSVRMMLPPIAEYNILGAHMDLAFITLDPRSMLLPMLFSKDFVFYVNTGKGQVGIVKDYDIVQSNLKTGDAFRIPAGTVFHVFNNDNGQRLRIIGMLALDPKNTIHLIEEEQSLPQTFLFGGSLQNPLPALSGFDDILLEGALKVSPQEIKALMSKMSLPIVHIPANRSSALRGYLDYIMDPSIAMATILAKWKSLGAEKPFNLLKKTPSVKNKYGSTVSVGEGDFSELKRSGVGMFMINLTRESMLAPHMNPKCSEVSVVIQGEGIVQIVHPNGTMVKSFRVRVGDVFMVPRYYLMSQMASRDGEFVFMGFSTCSGDSQPQFFAGTNSIFNIIDMASLAPALGVPPELVTRFSFSQKDAVILPCPGCTDAMLQKIVEQEEEEKRQQQEEEHRGGGGDEDEKGREKQIEKEEEELRRKEEKQRRKEEMEKERQERERQEQDDRDKRQDEDDDGGDQRGGESDDRDKRQDEDDDGGDQRGGESEFDKDEDEKEPPRDGRDSWKTQGRVIKSIPMA